jgi:hypothetical protein
MLDWIGWVASAVFVSSYFCKQPAALRRVQGLAALMWVVYGAVIHALPVVAANLVVAGVAIWSSFARPTALPRPAGPTDPLPSDQG